VGELLACDDGPTSFVEQQHLVALSQVMRLAARSTRLCQDS